MTFKFVFRAGAALSIIYTAGCIPLTVGSTAQPVPVGTTVHSMSMYVVPNSVHDSIDNRSYPRYGIDPEVRFGLDDRSDIGVRAPSFSGIVANYKPVSYTHLRAHETVLDLVCRLLLEKKKK